MPTIFSILYSMADSTFCPHCGTLLTQSDLGKVSCDKCLYQCSMTGEPLAHNQVSCCRQLYLFYERCSASLLAKHLCCDCGGRLVTRNFTDSTLPWTSNAELTLPNHYFAQSNTCASSYSCFLGNDDESQMLRTDMPNAATVTKSFPKQTPEWKLEYLAAEAARKGGADAGKQKNKRATVSEECPKCKVCCRRFISLRVVRIVKRLE